MKDETYEPEDMDGVELRYDPTSPESVERVRRHLREALGVEISAALLRAPRPPLWRRLAGALGVGRTTHV